jgi:HAD superfamily hydrolase (TIGR01459 family)
MGGMAIHDDRADRCSMGFLDGLSRIASHYDVLLCDIWGVLHNGVAAYAEASDALTRYREAGGVVVLMSNAPRPNPEIAPQLASLGVSRGAFDAIVTSGDVTRNMIADRGEAPFFWIGPQRDLPLFAGLSAQQSTLEQAAYVVCTGLFDDETETPDDYAPLLDRVFARRLDMICANPDLVVERGTKLIYCGGAIAEAYRALGGVSLYAGKPHRPIYEASMVAAERIRGHGVEPERVLAIGDAFRTDIAGATAFGIGSLLIARGIHTAEFGLTHTTLTAAHAERLLAEAPVRPGMIMDRLVW